MTPRRDWPPSLHLANRILVAGRLRPGEREITNQWRVPNRDMQLTLFLISAEEALADATVSRDDVERWCAAGWLSPKLLTASGYDQPDLFELAFVRDLARSGLSDAQIGRLLSQLPQPYSYDSTRVAYSFHYGWVELPLFYSEKEVKGMIDDFLEEWVVETAEQNPPRLVELQRLIEKTLDRRQAEEDEDEE